MWRTCWRRIGLRRKDVKRFVGRRRIWNWRCSLLGVIRKEINSHPSPLHPGSYSGRKQSLPPNKLLVDCSSLLCLFCPEHATFWGKRGNDTDIPASKQNAPFVFGFGGWLTISCCPDWALFVMYCSWCAQTGPCNEIDSYGSSKSILMGLYPMWCRQSNWHWNTEDLLQKPWGTALHRGVGGGWSTTTTMTTFMTPWSSQLLPRGLKRHRTRRLQNQHLIIYQQGFSNTKTLANQYCSNNSFHCLNEDECQQRINKVLQKQTTKDFKFVFRCSHRPKLDWNSENVQYLSLVRRETCLWKRIKQWHSKEITRNWDKYPSQL